MIKFIEKEEVNQLTFRDVKDNEFFVDCIGRLCQKCDDEWVNVIAEQSGYPSCMRESFLSVDQITRIINIERIEF